MVAIGKGGAIAAAALVLAAGAIGYRLYDGKDVSAAPETAADPLTALEQDARDNPGDAGALQRLGFAYFDAGRFAESAEAYAKAAEISPLNAVLWSRLGEALVMASERDPMP